MRRFRHVQQFDFLRQSHVVRVGQLLFGGQRHLEHVSGWGQLKNERKAVMIMITFIESFCW